VLYIVVLRFLKISIFGSKPKGVSLGFYRKMSVCNENWPKIIFYPREGHIIARLDIMVLYTNFFWGFKKYWVSAQTTKGFAFGFTEKCLFTAKNEPKIYISAPWGPDSFSVRHFVLYIHF
jgi:hypothetical protein